MLTRDSIEKITNMFALPATGLEQDWEVELADGARVEEFVRGYDSDALDDSDRFALMALILASIDAYLGASEALPSAWGRVCGVLAKDRALHADTISYWVCEGEDDPEGWFELTPHLRALALQ